MPPKGPCRAPVRSPWCTSSRWFASPAPAGLHQWIRESHNVQQDYERAFGRPAPKVKGVRLQINSQHTGSSAESYFGEVAFRNTRE